MFSSNVQREDCLLILSWQLKILLRRRDVVLTSIGGFISADNSSSIFSAFSSNLGHSSCGFLRNCGPRDHLNFLRLVLSHDSTTWESIQNSFLQLLCTNSKASHVRYNLESARQPINSKSGIDFFFRGETKAFTMGGTQV